MTIKVDQHGLPVQASRPAVSQNVTIGASSTQSAVFQTGPITNTYNPDGTLNTNMPNNTTHIRVIANSNCWVAFGANPTATAGAGSILLSAYTPEYFWVQRGERVAVIQDTAAGTLNVAELAN